MVDLRTYVQTKELMGLINIILWIVFGIIAGGIAKMIMPGDDPGNMNDAGGIAITALIGIAGSFVGGIIGNLIGLNADGRFSLGSLILAILGAVLLLWGYRKIKEKEA